MKRVILSMLVSLDGQVARRDRNLDWFSSEERLEADLGDQLREIDAMVFGRVAYQELAAYWPTAAAEPGASPARIANAHLMNAIPKVVVSRTLTDPRWGPVRVIGKNLAEEIGQMKQGKGKDIAVFAGARLAATFMRLDLVDEYRLYLHPVILGQGIPLFQELSEERPLTLIGHKIYDSGVCLLHYRRTGRAG